MEALTVRGPRAASRLMDAIEASMRVGRSISCARCGTIHHTLLFRAGAELACRRCGQVLIVPWEEVSTVVDIAPEPEAERVGVHRVCSDGNKMGESSNETPEDPEDSEGFCDPPQGSLSPQASLLRDLPAGRCIATGAVNALPETQRGDHNRTADDMPLRELSSRVSRPASRVGRASRQETGDGGRETES